MSNSNFTIFSIKYEIGAWLFTILPPIEIFLSLVLNTLSYLIYSKNTFKNSTTVFYLKLLSLTDTISVLP